MLLLLLLVSVQALTLPRSTGLEVMASLYGCSSSTTSRLLASLILAVLLREGRFCCESQHPPLQLSPAVHQQLLGLLHGEGQLVKPASTLLRDLFRWQRQQQSASAATQRQRGGSFPSEWTEGRGSRGPIHAANLQDLKQPATPQDATADDGRNARAAEAISAMPLLLILDALRAPEWRHGV